MSPVLGWALGLQQCGRRFLCGGETKNKLKIETRPMGHITDGSRRRHPIGGGPCFSVEEQDFSQLSGDR